MIVITLIRWTSDLNIFLLTKVCVNWFIIIKRILPTPSGYDVKEARTLGGIKCRNPMTFTELIEYSPIY